MVQWRVRGIDNQVPFFPDSQTEIDVVEHNLHFLIKPSHFVKTDFIIMQAAAVTAL